MSKKDKNEKLESVLPLLHKKRGANHKYTDDQIQKIATRVLNVTTYSLQDTATPIVQVCQELGLHIVWVGTYEDYSCSLLVDGTGNSVQEKYGYNSVVTVNRHISSLRQKVMIANELGYFLLFYFYRDKRKRFVYSHVYNPYYNSGYSKKAANRFALEILLPMDAFSRQHKTACDMDSNPIFISLYLSRIFQVPVSFIDKRLRDCE